MWVSIPVTRNDMEAIEALSGQWRRSNHDLYRQSKVELALVDEEAWQKWGLPAPAAPILTLTVPVGTELDDRLQELGGTWESRPSKQEWGVTAGFVRLPSGLLLELKYDD